SVGKPLTAVEHTDQEPCWMPDGQTLLFTSKRRGPRDIWKLSLSSALAERLTTTPGDKSAPHVSADGRWGGFDMEGQSNSVYVMRADGGDLHLLHPKLPDQFRSAGGGRWSPDGSRLACSFVPRDGERRIGIADIDVETGTARHIRLLNLDGSMPSYPVWS